MGTQAKLIAAAAVAAEQGYHLNTLLTVRWNSLWAHDNGNALFAVSVTERIAHLVELLRKWVGARCRGDFLYLWSREVSEGVGEHWHLALHLPRGKRSALASYLETLLGEARAPHQRTRHQGRTEGEFACSVWGSWHLAEDVQPKRHGYYLAAYLGKAEPSQRIYRGKLVNNTRKPVRGRAYGGSEKTGKYDVPQGTIIGTVARDKRFDIARPLKKALK